MIARYKRDAKTFQEHKLKNIFIFSAGIFLLLFASSSQANKVKKMDIDAPDGYSKAPLIKVYSTDGEKWDRIDKTASTMIEVKLNAECKYEGKGNKAYRGSMTVPGYTAQGDPAPAKPSNVARLKWRGARVVEWGGLENR